MTHISYTQADQQFLADVNAYIECYISKQVITMAMIADSLQMNHATIHHKIRLLYQRPLPKTDLKTCPISITVSRTSMI